jgi:hypothetical protein
MFQKVNVPLLGVAENMSWFMDPAGVRHTLCSVKAAEHERRRRSVRCCSVKCLLFRKFEVAAMPVCHWSSLRLKRLPVRFFATSRSRCCKHRRTREPQDRSPYEL